MRVVGGTLRGRNLRAPSTEGVRPTSDRTREAVFNVLMHRFQGQVFRGQPFQLSGARVLDAFAGSGALGIEALSRGAGHATFMDTNAAARAALADNLKTLNLLSVATSLTADATRPPKAPQAVAVAFLDPPYDDGLMIPALTALNKAGWLGEATLCVCERRSGSPLLLPEGYSVLDERRYGQATVAFIALSISP